MVVPQKTRAAFYGVCIYGVYCKDIKISYLGSLKIAWTLIVAIYFIRIW